MKSLSISNKMKTRIKDFCSTLTSNEKIGLDVATIYLNVAVWR